MLRFARLAGLLLAAGIGIGAIAVSQSGRGSESRIISGSAVRIGEGAARLFVELGPKGEPSTIGIAFDEGVLRGLAPKMNSTSRCFDKDRDGQLAHGECIGDYQFNFSLPKGTENLQLPFKFATVNWNPEGHMEPAPKVWSVGHYDFHFYIVEPSAIEAIRAGPCAELIDCDDFKRASMPLPTQYQPEGYLDVGAAVARMGNHLVDSKDPELANPALGFSSTFIYGAYDGRLIFLEPMVSHSFLSSKPNRCIPVRSAQAFATSGYYPTQYCVRYDESTRGYRVTLEGLTYRKAT